jgi:hypothetical protein
LVAAGGSDQLGGEPLLVLEQDLQQVLRRQALIAAAQRQRFSGLEACCRSRNR